MVLLQETVEPQMQGRVFGLVQIVSSSALPLGMAIFGPLADVVSVEWLLIITHGATGSFHAFVPQPAGSRTAPHPGLIKIGGMRTKRFVNLFGFLERYDGDVHCFFMICF